jgi:hypothetical protein
MLAFSLKNFLGEYVWNRYYFFLKCLVRYSSKATWVCGFLCGKASNDTLNLFNRAKQVLKCLVK